MQVVKNQIKAFLEEFLDPNRIKKKGFPTMSGVGPVGPKFKPNPQSKFKVSNEFMAGMNVMLDSCLEIRPSWCPSIRDAICNTCFIPEY